jgi:glutaredoxin 3
MKVRLYIKPWCGWCHEAMEWLDERNIPYEKLDVSTSESTYQEMVKISGQTLAPVMDVDGEVLADFGTDELAKFWKKIAPANKTA